MDIVFWGPWLVGFLVFVIWIKQPIQEFRQMWRDQQARYAEAVKQSEAERKNGPA